MSIDAMRTAAAAWLEATAGAQLGRHPFATGERFVWHYTPMPRRGIPIGAMTPAQREAASALLASGLSAEGYASAQAIMAHEHVLAAVERAEIGEERYPRDPALYHFTVFGDPSRAEPWGWRVDGHHLSLHFSVIDGQLRSDPSFFGANPAKAPDGTRILASLEDRGRDLLALIGDAAIISTDAPGDILTTNRPSFDQLPAVGACASDMDGAQVASLTSLVEAHTSRLRERPILDLGAAWFAWAGPTAVGEPHYYRIQGEHWLIEYDNVQNGANHIHAVLRDVRRDFGRDLLGEHHAAAH